MVGIARHRPSSACDLIPDRSVFFFFFSWMMVILAGGAAEASAGGGQASPGVRAENVPGDSGVCSARVVLGGFFFQGGCM